MHPELQHCRRLLEHAVAGLDDDRGSIRVGGRWSIAEIVEHLHRTYSGTVKGFERCIAAGASRASPATLMSRLRVFTVVSLGYFPTGVEAPKQVAPTGQEPLSAAMRHVHAHLESLDAAASEVAACLGRGRVMDHPILGPCTVEEWLRFHHRHTRHHYKQIMQRRRQLDGVA
jgi:hypothetical protein